MKKNSRIAKTIKSQQAVLALLIAIAILLFMNFKFYDPIDSKVVPALTGMMTETTNNKKWFHDIAKWGVKRWDCFSPHYRAKEFQQNDQSRISGLVKGNEQTIPWLEEIVPGFDEYQNKMAYEWQLKIIKASYDGCVENNIDFHYAFPFPIFPFQDIKVVKKVIPQIFNQNGRLDLSNSFLQDLLKNYVRLLKKKLPELKGVTVWMCEGNGELIKFDENELQNNKPWLRAWMSALDTVSKELKIEGTVFAHDYFHTNKTRRNVYEALAEFPDLIAMEDNTWPEENALCSPFNFIPSNDRDFLFSNNHVYQNCLTDCEYLGQGFYPSILPRWWKESVNAAIKHGVKIVNGRTFFWDRGTTDFTFNRMNAYMLTYFCYHPNAHPKTALTKAVHEFFGKNIPEKLIDIFYDTEPILKEVISINGISPLAHSGYPKLKFLDRDYFNNVRYMKAVDDLFKPQGTKLYVPVNDDLDASLQWRVQNQIVAKSYNDYLSTKDKSIQWLEKTIHELEQLTKNLSIEQRKLIMDSYSALLLLAKGMKLFLETAKTHYDWHRVQILTDMQAELKFSDLANRLKELASSSHQPPLNIKEDMLRFSDGLKVITRVRPN